MSNPYESPKSSDLDRQKQRPKVIVTGFLLAVLLPLGLLVFGAMAIWLMTPAPILTPVQPTTPPQQTIQAEADE